MSDFLSDLVARSVGSAPVIRPRRPSLFEPLNAYTGSFGESSPIVLNERQPGAATPGAFEESEESGRSPAPPEHNRRQDFPAARRRIAPVIPDPVPATAGSPRAGRSLPGFEPPPPGLDAAYDSPWESPQPAEYRRVATGREAQTARQPQGSLAVPEESSPTPVFSTPTSAPLALFSEIARNEKRLRETAASERHPRSLTAPEPASTNEAQPAITSTRRGSPTGQTAPRNLPSSLATGTLNTPRTSSPALPAMELPAASRFNFARHIPPAQRLNPPEPTIHVTIGRIDVRAVAPQTSSAKERPASPVMSLNDYLRSKRGEA